MNNTILLMRFKFKLILRRKGADTRLRCKPTDIINN